MAAIAVLAAAEAELRSATHSTIRTLEKVIPHLYERSSKVANAALSLKRTLYKSRHPRESEIDIVLEMLDTADADCVRRALHALNQVIKIGANYEATYSQELEEVSLRAIETLRKDHFFAAMCNSNPDLAARIGRAGCEPNKMKAKDLANAKSGAVRQVARISLKTSPFSLYGEVRIGGWPDDGFGDIPSTKMARSRPNYGPIGYVVESLATDFDKLNDDATLRLNSSLTVDQDILRWRKIENVPPRSRVRHATMTESTTTSMPLKLVVAALGREDVNTKSELMSFLQATLPGQDRLKIARLVRSALASQLIVCGAIYGKHPLEAARSVMQSLETELGLAVSIRLNAIVEAANSGDAGRTAMQMVELAQVAGVEIGPRDVRPAIFQDVYFSGRAFTFGEKPDFVDDLATAVRFAQLLQQGHIAMARRNLVTHFVETHGECAEVPAIPFLLNYVRLMTEGTPDLRSYEASGDVQKQTEISEILALLEDRDRYAVSFTTAFARDVIEKESGPRAVSQMCFMQEYSVDGKVHYALNHCHAGWASTFSRFLDDDSWAIGSVRNYLEMISEEGGAAEILGWFGFNAADRPNFLTRKVYVPPIDDPESDAHSLRAYTLRHRPEFSDLVFRAADGQDTTLAFTALLATGAMPLPHLIARMLGANTESVVETWAPFIAYVQQGADGIKRCPRIDVGRITICRRQLIAPYVRVPGFNQDDAAFFRTFNEWMDSEAMPRWIYVSPPDDWSSGSEVQRRQKPMPVDRSNPAMVNAMRKEIATTSGEVRFVEALPQPTDIKPNEDGERFMTELGVEFAVVRSSNLL
jgi:hypothetical protein